MKERVTTRDLLINDFHGEAFTKLFKDYFWELGVKIQNWEKLWDEMSESGTAYIRLTESDIPVGFIMFDESEMKNWFFKEKIGFIREFYVDSNFRNNNHGSELLQLCEKYFLERDIHRMILTTDSVPEFYLKRGYINDSNIKAKNNDEVFTKMI